MKLLIQIFCLLFVLLITQGCYTNLKYSPFAKRDGILDLKLITVKHLPDYSKVGKYYFDDRDGYLPRAHFSIIVSNAGPDLFYGKLLFTWADRKNDIDSNLYPNRFLFSPPSNKLFPGDTLSIEHTISRRFYASGTELKFQLVGLKSDYPGTYHLENSSFTQVYETNIENNEFKLITQFDDVLLNGKVFH